MQATSPGFRMRVQVARRDLDRFPRDDDSLGENLFGLLDSALQAGRVPRPAMMVFREDQVDHFDILPALQTSRQHGHRLLSALVGQDQVEGAALVGVLVVRQNRPDAPPMRAAVCFAEWPDNRWWNAWQPLDQQNRPVGEAPVVRRAIDGFPKPGGLGGWFAAARRHRLKLRMQPVGQGGEPAMVH